VTSGGLLRASLVYGAANILQRAIPFLLLPLLTRYLSKADFGRLATFTAVAGVATPLIGFNVSYGLRRRFYDLDAEELGRYLAACVFIVVVGTGVGALLVLGARGPLLSATGLPALWLVLAIVYAGSQTIILLPLTLWQVEHAAVRYSVVQVARAAVLASFTVVAVVAWGHDWRGAVGALVATSVAVLLFVAGPAMLRWIKSWWRREHIDHALRYGGGLIPHTLGALAITNADRFFITHHAGAEETGVYWIGYQIGFVVAVAADAMIRAWSPWLFERLKAGDDDRMVVRRSYQAFAGLLVLALAVGLVAPWVVRFVLGAEVAGAERYAPWIAGGFAFNGMFRLMSVVAYFHERTVALSLVTVSAAALNLMLDAILVPRFGAIGAAQATLFAFALSFVLMFALARKLHRLPWRG